MATLTLYRLWINLLDTGAAVTTYSSDRSEDEGITGDVMTFAGGRQRAILSEGTQRQYAFKLRDVTDANVAILKSWKGRAVCVRNDRGLRLFGVYFDVKIDERKTKGLYDLSMSVTEITYQEGT